jgi:hypothetical protein
LDSYEIKVHSEGYGETHCVVDISAFLMGRKVHPCGDGTDYRLRRKDIERVYSHIEKTGRLRTK